MIVIVLSIAAPVALAAPAAKAAKSPVPPPPIPTPLTPKGRAAYEIVEIFDDEEKDKDEDYNVDFEHRVWVPIPDMYMYSYGERRKLDPTEITNFENNYAMVKKETKDLIMYFFWLTLSDKYLVYLEEYDDYYFRLDFSLPAAAKGEKIVFSSNGVDIEDKFVMINDDGTVTVLFEYLPAPITIRLTKTDKDKIQK